MTKLFCILALVVYKTLYRDINMYKTVHKKKNNSIIV
jgi:hypothetical protein